MTVGSKGETATPREVADLSRVTIDRSVEGTLLRDLFEGIDVLVDVIPYEIVDAEQLVALKDVVGSVIAVSTTSVYADDDGRTLDEATGEEDFPRLPVPILETQRRVVPSDDTYSTKKAAIEDILLGQDELTATVIHPCAIYGPGDSQCPGSGSSSSGPWMVGPSSCSPMKERQSSTRPLYTSVELPPLFSS